jgi:thioredoxin 1
MLGPVIDEIATEVADRALVAKVNVDDARDLARRFGIKSIPTLSVIKDGQVIERLSGVQTKSRILEALAAA